MYPTKYPSEVVCEFDANPILALFLVCVCVGGGAEVTP